MPLDAARAAFPGALRQARRALGRLDARWAALVKQAGPCGLALPPRVDPFAALLSAITHQQLHGRAAATILGRVHARFGEGKPPRAETIASARLDALRRCGLSRAKALAVKDLARKALDGTVPTSAQLRRLEDEAIVARLTTVRGVGRWTVEMLLMFQLGRLDVLPVDDFGVRKGFGRLLGGSEPVSRGALLVAAEAWRPYRSVASWYLWRAAEAPEGAFSARRRWAAEDSRPGSPRAPRRAPASPPRRR